MKFDSWSSLQRWNFLLEFLNHFFSVLFVLFCRSRTSLTAATTNVRSRTSGAMTTPLLTSDKPDHIRQHPKHKQTQFQLDCILVHSHFVALLERIMRTNLQTIWGFFSCSLSTNRYYLLFCVLSPIRPPLHHLVFVAKT